MELQNVPFFQNLIRFFSEKSHSAEKKFQKKTIFLKPKTDRKAVAYPLIRFREKTHRVKKAQRTINN